MSFLQMISTITEILANEIYSQLDNYMNLQRSSFLFSITPQQRRWIRIVAVEVKDP